jgi:DNA processing protein
MVLSSASRDDFNMDRTELLYTLALQNLPNLGDSTAKKLIRKLGSAQQVFSEKKQHLLKIDG